MKVIYAVLALGLIANLSYADDKKSDSDNPYQDFASLTGCPAGWSPGTGNVLCLRPGAWIVYSPDTGKTTVIHEGDQKDGSWCGGEGLLMSCT